MVGRPFVIPACISYYQTGGFPKPPFAALDFSTSSLVFGGFPKSLLIQCILPHQICLLPDVGGFPGALLVSAHTLPTSHIQLISLLLIVRGFPGYLPVSVYSPSAPSETTYFPPCCQGIPNFSRQHTGWRGFPGHPCLPDFSFSPFFCFLPHQPENQPAFFFSSSLFCFLFKAAASW